MGYKFSKVNPIEEKKLYMYSDYKGLEFINDYLVSRQNDIQKIFIKLKNNKHNLKEIRNKSAYFQDESIRQNIEDLVDLILPKIEYFKNKENFELNDISYDIELLFNQLKKKKKINMHVLNKLIKEYEVRKILNVEEAANISTKKKREIVEIYHLTFTIILIQAFLSNINLLKIFNTLLKINDLLTYRFYKKKNFHIDVLYYVLIIEIKLFKSLKLKFLGN